MEYLDPVKKRQHRRLIVVGYFLIGILIFMITVIVLLAGYGYDWDRKTGEIVQNGIAFVDTKHRSAKISLNNKDYGNTDLRLVLREGDYDVLAQRKGYRPWHRKVSIVGGKLRQLTYPILIPNQLRPENRYTLKSAPTKAFQSIDKNRIITWSKSQPKILSVLDISKQKPTEKKIDLAKALAKNKNLNTADIKDIQFIDFDRYDQRILLNLTTSKQKHTVQIDTSDPNKSLDITALLPQAMQKNVQITMLDRNPKRFIARDTKNKEVYLADLVDSKALRLAPLPVGKRKILALSSYGEKWFLYATESQQKGLVDILFNKDGEERVIKQVKKSEKYFLELAKNGDSPLIGIAASAEKNVYVYTNPIDYLNNNDSVFPAPVAIMALSSVMDITISSDASIILAHDGKNVVSYDLQPNELWRWELKHQLKPGQKIHWIDGQHFSYVQDQNAWLYDFDGSNINKLTSANNLGIFYRKDSVGYFAFKDIKKPKNQKDQKPQNDQPATQLQFVSLLSAEDL